MKELSTAETLLLLPGRLAKFRFFENFSIITKNLRLVCSKLYILRVVSPMAFYARV